MNTTFLANTGLRVSELTFGTMSFGTTADEAASRDMFNMCVDAGINMFDCANMYANGTSEKMLGKFIKGRRDEFIITSKVYFPMSSLPNDQGLSRRHIMQAAEASLKRLGTDYIDVYYLHRFDDHTDLHHTLRALDDLVTQGKILYPALSNFAAWQVTKALGICAREGWAKPICIQPMHNLLKRQAEVELLPMAQSEDLGVFPYSPLAAGMLTGKYNNDTPAEGRLVESAQYKTRYGQEHMLQVARDFTDVAQDLGHNPVALAIAWSAATPGVTAPIIGARHTGQLKGVLEACDVDMTPQLWQLLSALTPPVPSATDRTEEGTDAQHSTR